MITYIAVLYIIELPISHVLPFQREPQWQVFGSMHSPLFSQGGEHTAAKIQISCKLYWEFNGFAIAYNCIIAVPGIFIHTFLKSEPNS